MTRPTITESESLRIWRDQTLYRLLLRATRAETTTTIDRLQARGYLDVSLTDSNLLANLDTEGTTISALARRAGVSRQAASQQVAALERSGYVERLTSPTDARASVIIQSKRGTQLLNDALDIVEQLESSYADHLGDAGLRRLKRQLQQLLDHIDPAGTLGRD